MVSTLSVLRQFLARPVKLSASVPVHFRVDTEKFARARIDTFGLYTAILALSPLGKADCEYAQYI